MASRFTRFFSVRFVGVTLLIAVVAGILAPPLDSESWGPRTTGNDYWDHLLRYGRMFQGVSVDEDANDIIWASHGVDDVLYCRVSKDDAKRAYSSCVKAAISTNLAELENNAKDQIPSDDQVLILRALTGQAFGDEAKAWQQWWELNKENFIAPPNAYESIKGSWAARCAKLGVYDITGDLARKRYRHFKYHIPEIETVIAVSIVVVVALVSRSLYLLFQNKHQPTKPALQ